MNTHEAPTRNVNLTSSKRRAQAAQACRVGAFNFMKNILLAFLMMISVVMNAQELNPGISFVDGQRLTAAQLQLLVSGATILPPFYTDKIAQSNIVSTDILLVYSPSSGTFHKVTGANGIFGNSSIITAQTTYTSVNNTNYFFLGYDSTNAVLFKVNGTNFFWTGAPLIQVAALNFSNTLSAYSPAQPNPLYLTNALMFLVWDTNGIPKFMTESNLLYSMLRTQGTNLDVPFVYNDVFQPWTVYGTNTANFTNAWGTLTNFPITSLTLTNAYNPSNTTPTLTATDTVPVFAWGQKTNTTATLKAVGDFLTNSYSLTSNPLKCFGAVPSTGATNHSSFYGTTNVAHTATGTYVINFITPFADTNYSLVTSGARRTDGDTTATSGQSFTTTNVTVVVKQVGQTAADGSFSFSIFHP